MKNYIGISRCIVNHWIYEDAEYFKAWFEMVYRARWKEEDKKELIEGQLVTIKRGYFIFGRITWSKRLGITERRLRTLIDKLLADNMIELVEKHNKFTIYKIVNYEKYNQQSDQQEIQENQPFTDYSDHQNDQQVTSKRPTSDQQTTTKEEREDRGKNDKYISNGTNSKVFTPPTIENVIAYCKERNNCVDVNKWYDFYTSKGWMIGKNKMKDWKAAVRTWEKKENVSNDWRF